MKPYIIIASLGRCGTTLTVNAIRVVLLQKETVQDIYVDIIDWYSYFKPNKVYATHDYAPKFNPKQNPKVLFLFGDPRNIIVSVIEYKGDAHFKHLGADYKDRRFCFSKDILNLESHFDSWYKQQSFSFMSVRYETMFEHLEEIDDFLQIKPLWPIKENRDTNWELHKEAELINKTYSKLTKKISNAEDIKIWSKYDC